MFSISDKGTALWLTDAIGEPVEGERLETELGETVILAVGEPGIRDRACLTGKKVSPYGSILTDLPMPEAKKLYDTIVRTVEGAS